MLYDNFTVIFDECKGGIFKKSQITANSRNWLTGAAGPGGLASGAVVRRVEEPPWLVVFSNKCRLRRRLCSFPLVRLPYADALSNALHWRELACFRRSMCRPKIRFLD